MMPSRSIRTILLTVLLAGACFGQFPPLSVQPATLPAGVVGQGYTAPTLVATGGASPYTWTIISPAPGLVLSNAGVISGTPTAGGIFNFTARVTDGIQQTATGSFQIVVNSPLSITLMSLPPGIVGQFYSAPPLVASGGVGPYIWTTSASLPPGLTLSTTGVISGTPTVNKAFLFTVTVVDQTQQTATGVFQITINGALATNSTTLPAGIVGVPYIAPPLQATGGVGPYTWTVISPAPGLTLSSTGVISGTPSVTGTFNFMAQVADRSQQTATGAFQIVINSSLTITSTTLPAGIVGVAYTPPPLQASGGMGPYTWTTITPAPGLTLSSAGVISGTPSGSGTFSFTAQVADRSQQTATAGFQIVINPLLTITPTALPGGIVGVAYTPTSLQTTGGVGPYTWTVVSPAPGLTLSSAGVISGTPATSGTFSFTAQVADRSQQTATAAFQIVINPSLTITPATLPFGFVSVAYTAPPLAAAGGVGPYTWTVVSPAPGLTLSSAGGISGTPATSGTFNFTAQVADRSQQTATAVFQIVINPLLTITPTTLPFGFVSVAYTAPPLAAAGGVAPYTWTVISPAPGLTLSRAGVISGTPSASGTFSFTAQVADRSEQTATGTFQIVVDSLLTVVPTPLPPTTLNAAYGPVSLGGSGGLPPYSWSVASGGLPPGINLSSSGALSGSASATGVFSFTAQLTDQSGQTARGSFSISVNQALQIIPVIVPAGTVGSVYPPVAFSVNGGGTFSWFAGTGLPPGLTLTPAGVLLGTPTQDGVFTFTVNASSQGGSAITTVTMRINPVIGLVGLPIATIDPNTPLQVTLGAAGGTPPHIFALGGCSIPGLSLSSTGVLSGTATTPGTYTCTIMVTDSNGASSSTVVTITVLPVLTIAGNVPAGVQNQAYGPATLTVSGGKPPYAFTVSAGALPGGLTLDGEGNINGTPTAAGTFSFTAKVTDAGGASIFIQFTIPIAAALAIAPTQLPDGTVNGAYPAVTLSATGGTPPYAWSTSGDVPPGLSLSPGGVLSGTPTQLGTFTFTARVTDAAKSAASVTFSLTVAVPGLVISASLPSATAGALYSRTVTATGGSGTLTWSLASGTLPPGLSLSPAGVLSGTPTANGTFSFTIQVSDAGQPPQSATQTITLQVSLPPTPPAQVGGLPDVIDAAQQPKFNLTLGSAFPVDIVGTLTLIFKSSAVVPADDPAIKFMNGSRTLDFTIPANQTAAVFPVPSIFSTGTVAGTITVTAIMRVGQADVTPTPAPVRTIVVNAAAPVVTSVSASGTGGITVTVQGFATPRQITQAKFHFTPSGTGTLQTSDITVDVNSAFTQWYQSSGSAAFGSAFTYSQPFTVQGSFTGSVSVTLVNDKGSSNTMSGQF